MKDRLLDNASEFFDFAQPRVARGVKILSKLGRPVDGDILRRVCFAQYTELKRKRVFWTNMKRNHFHQFSWLWACFCYPYPLRGSGMLLERLYVLPLPKVSCIPLLDNACNGPRAQRVKKMEVINLCSLLRSAVNMHLSWAFLRLQRGSRMIPIDRDTFASQVCEDGAVTTSTFDMKKRERNVNVHHAPGRNVSEE